MPDHVQTFGVIRDMNADAPLARMGLLNILIDSAGVL